MWTNMFDPLSYIYPQIPRPQIRCPILYDLSHQNCAGKKTQKEVDSRYIYIYNYIDTPLKFIMDTQNKSYFQGFPFFKSMWKNLVYMCIYDLYIYIYYISYVVRYSRDRRSKRFTVPFRSSWNRKVGGPKGEKNPMRFHVTGKRREQIDQPHEVFGIITSEYKDIHLSRDNWVYP